MIYAKSIITVLPKKNKYKNNKHLNSLSFELYTRQTLTFLLQQRRNKVDMKYSRVLSCKFALYSFMYHIFSRRIYMRQHVVRILELIYLFKENSYLCGIK